MTDRELLELAAKAEGRAWLSYSSGYGKGLCCRDTRFGGLIEYFWNPLEDDGDALRLAVKMFSRNVVIEGGSGGVTVDIGHPPIDADEWQEPGLDFDPYAATRRSIVRAAAEIGKTMK